MKALYVSFVVALPLAACQDTSSPLFPGALTAVSVSIAPQAVRSGDPAMVSVSLVNRTSAPMVIKGGVCPFDFEIQNGAGHAVFTLPREPCVAVAIAFTLNPRDSTTRTFHWVADASGGGPLMPGSYSLQASCDWVPGVLSPRQPFIVTP